MWLCGCFRQLKAVKPQAAIPMTKTLAVIGSMPVRARTFTVICTTALQPRAHSPSMSSSFLNAGNHFGMFQITLQMRCFALPLTSMDGRPTMALNGG